MSRQSFTLIELLVVIAIIAILAVVVVLTLNPTELLKQARDSNRLNDANTLKTAIGLFESDTLGTGSLGSNNILYVSVPDPTATTTSGTGCQGINIPTSSLPTGYTFWCPASSTYRNVDGTGWLPINFAQISSGAPFSNLPIDPVNNATSGLYYTYISGGSYEFSLFTESAKYKDIAQNDGGSSDNAYEIGTNITLSPLVFPNNWVKVPGNSTYGTSDFYVMKYEAKYSKTGAGKGDNAGTCIYTAGYDTWDYATTTTTGDCPSSWTANNVVSSAYGSPIAGITHTQALSACPSGSHLLTNAEWMTIARNAEQVAANWSGGSVGSGVLMSGNTGTNGTGSYNGSDPEKGANRNGKAKLKLSNGEEI